MTGVLRVSLVGVVAGSVLFVRDTRAHVELEAETGSAAAWTPSVLRACRQAGFVNNLNDALAWGLAPLYLAAHGASVRQIGLVAAAYPLVWGVGQLGTGWLSDSTGRKPLIIAGMLVSGDRVATLLGRMLRPVEAPAAARPGADVNQS